MRYVEPLPVKLGTINKQVKQWTVPVSWKRNIYL
jgi:hypothetical protein